MFPASSACLCKLCIINVVITEFDLLKKILLSVACVTVVILCVIFNLKTQISNNIWIK